MYGKLFIGGISWDTNEERLKEYFDSFGEVLEAVIMKDRTSGRTRGFGFVVFSDPAAADRVILEKHNIDGRMAVSDLVLRMWIRANQEEKKTRKRFSSIFGKMQMIHVPDFETVEMRALGESLSRDIVRENLDVKWENIKALENAKHLLKEGNKDEGPPVASLLEKRR